MKISTFIFVFILDAITIYGFYLDYKENDKTIKAKQRKLDNLISDTLYIELTEEENDILEHLVSYYDCKNEQDYIRKALKGKI